MSETGPTERAFEPQVRRSRFGPAVIVAALALLVGLALMAFAMRDAPGWWPIRAAAPVPAAAPQVQAPPAAVVSEPALPTRETALAAQIASLEARAATLGAIASVAESRAGRAEAILVAFATRRALDRGVGLGYLEEQVRARFGATAPRETATVIHAARNPVTLEDLRQSLDTAVPILFARDDDWWAGIGSALRDLIVIHKAGTPSPLPAERLARARRMLETGNVEAALAEVARLPGAARATNWTNAARRYVETHRALDQLEAVAIVGPIPDAATPPAVATPAPVQSPVPEAIGNQV